MAPVLLMEVDRNTTGLTLAATNFQGTLENASIDHRYPAIVAGRGALGCCLGFWDQYLHSLWSHIYEDGLD